MPGNCPIDGPRWPIKNRIPPQFLDLGANQASQQRSSPREGKREISMSRYTYSMGAWTQGNAAPDWEDNEDFHDYIARIGYSVVKCRLGNEHAACIDIHTSEDAKTFYASVSPDGNNVYEVFISDFPSLMLFLKDFGSTFSLLGIEIYQEEMREMVEKLFNAYHGHGAYDICKQCSPVEWQARQGRERAS